MNLCEWCTWNEYLNCEGKPKELCEFFDEREDEEEEKK